MDNTHKLLTEIIECMRYTTHRKSKLDKAGDGVDVCLYHIPRIEDKIICKYRGEEVQARMYRPDGSYDLIKYYECTRG